MQEQTNVVRNKKGECKLCQFFIAAASGAHISIQKPVVHMNVSMCHSVVVCYLYYLCHLPTDLSAFLFGVLS